MGLRSGVRKSPAAFALDEQSLEAKIVSCAAWSSSTRRRQHNIVCGCCPHPRAPGALALSLDRERDLEMDTETEPKQSQTHLSDSHFISLAARAGCDTIRCHTTAWNASVCGVTVLELTVGTITQAS